MNDEKSPILWVILPPEAREQFAAQLDNQEALPEKFANKELKRLNHEPLYQKRIFQAAKAINGRMGIEPGWGEWPADPHECLAIGLILGAMLEREIPEILLDLPEEELAKLEDECRASGVSVERIIIERLTAALDRKADPSDWWKG
jgi:hypothetical protein